ncbi:hypothetical protein HY480_04390 [Candidatus Uhrbacteria bacterium]|nr:hypothetical protein [Candidatus Uhrbacteria bacterium]
MPWYIPVIARIIVGNICGQIVLKKVTGLPSRTRRFVWQFFFAALLSWIAIAITGSTPTAWSTIAIIAVVGFVNSGGAYFQWRAIEISQSKTAVFTWADDLIAIGLGYVILAEHRVLTPSLAIGVVICVGACVAIGFSERHSGTNDPSRTTFALIGWIAGYSVIWGIAAFVMRYYGVRDVPISTFAAAWYTGALVGALVIRSIIGVREQGAPLTGRGIAGTFVLASFIWLALILAYWSRMLAPITVVQPIHQVSEMVFPALVGLFIFKESRTFTTQGKFLLALACAGGIMVALSFS